MTFTIKDKPSSFKALQAAVDSRINQRVGETITIGGTDYSGTLEETPYYYDGVHQVERIFSIPDVGQTITKNDIATLSDGREFKVRPQRLNGLIVLTLGAK